MQFNSVDGADYSKKESEELRKLRRENKRLQEAMEFLKKTAAYFANDHK
jgi:transposase